MSARKKEMIDFLEENSLNFSPASTKATLLEIINEFVSTQPEKFNRKVVEEMCERHGVQVIN
jgi:hypothetical protein